MSDWPLMEKYRAIAANEGNRHGDVTLPQLRAMLDQALDKIEVLEHERDHWHQRFMDPLGYVDALHPSGKCACCGEGRCGWCQATEASHLAFIRDKSAAQRFRDQRDEAREQAELFRFSAWTHQPHAVDHGTAAVWHPFSWESAEAPKGRSEE